MSDEDLVLLTGFIEGLSGPVFNKNDPKTTRYSEGVWAVFINLY